MKTFNFNCSVRLDLQGKIKAETLEEAMALALIRWSKQNGVQGILDNWANKTYDLPFSVHGWAIYPTVDGVKDGKGKEEIVRGNSLDELQTNRRA